MQETANRYVIVYITKLNLKSIVIYDIFVLYRKIDIISQKCKVVISDGKVQKIRLGCVL